MRFQRPTLILVSAVAVVLVANGLNVGLSKSEYSTNFPAFLEALDDKLGNQ